MKLAKLLLITAASAGAALFVSCSSFDDDTEKDPSSFWQGDRPSAETGKTSQETDIDLRKGAFAQESNKPGEYGDFSAEKENYLGKFGRRITNAPAFIPVYFAFDTFAVPLSETAKADAVAQFLNKYPNTGVVVEGHCDERGTQEYNRALGERRAISVKTALMDRGIAEDRIATQSFGEDKPAVSGSNETAWTRNRRAEFVPVLLNTKTVAPLPAPVR